MLCSALNEENVSSPTKGRGCSKQGLIHTKSVKSPRFLTWRRTWSTGPRNCKKWRTPARNSAICGGVKIKETRCYENLRIFVSLQK